MSQLFGCSFVVWFRLFLNWLASSRPWISPRERERESGKAGSSVDQYSACLLRISASTTFFCRWQFSLSALTDRTSPSNREPAKKSLLARESRASVAARKKNLLDVSAQRSLSPLLLRGKAWRTSKKSRVVDFLDFHPIPFLGRRMFSALRILCAIAFWIFSLSLPLRGRV